MGFSSPWYQWQFRAFREMYTVRDFRLVLCADVPNCVVERAIQILEDNVKAEKLKGGLGYLYEPLIISERRTLRTRPTDYNVGSMRWAIPASAL
jgi:hypothetical protein